MISLNLLRDAESYKFRAEFIPTEGSQVYVSSTSVSKLELIEIDYQLSKLWNRVLCRLELAIPDIYREQYLDEIRFYFIF